MGDERSATARLADLARLQKQRHLSEAELWEAADLLRAMGKEDAAREAEEAALRQRAREQRQSPDATFSLGESASDEEAAYCRECGRQLPRAEAEEHYFTCRQCRTTKD